jgi:TolB protein
MFMRGKKYSLLAIASILVVGALSGCAGLFGKKETADVTITVASSSLQNVVRVTDNKFRKNAVQVSPDGTKLLYCEANETDPNKLLYLDDFRIMLLRDVNVSAKTPLVTEPSYSPVWFDDNIGYAYVAYEGSGSKLVKSNVTGGGKTYITRASAGDGDANPSVKGDRILCDTLVGGKRQLVSMKSNGTELTILGEGEQPSWHPGGTKFLFVRRSEERRGNSTFYPRSVYEMDIATNQVTQIYTAVIDEARGFAEVCSQPSYSPDGKYILFSKGGDIFLATVEKKDGGATGWLGGLFGGRSKVNVTERRLHLYLMKEDGTDLTQLTSGNVDVFSPAWGPNNDIYFISNVQDATEIWKAHLNL